jgi:hypothetical protein
LLVRFFLPLIFIDITADATGKSERKKTVRTFLPFRPPVLAAQPTRALTTSRQGNQIEWPEDLSDLPRGRNEHHDNQIERSGNLIKHLMARSFTSATGSST